MLDYQPAKFFRRQIIRRKFVPRGQSDLAPVIAPLPESLQQRCIAAPGLLAQVIVSKYCDHLPLYRQEQIYWNRHQVWLPRQSMARWVHLASEWLKPIYRQIQNQMMSGFYIQVDETPIRYLDPGNGKTGLGYLWVVHRSGEDVLFEWYTTREAKCLDKLIPPDFSGTILSLVEMQIGPIANNLAFIEYDLAIINADHGPELVVEELLPAVFDVFRESDPVADCDADLLWLEHTELPCLVKWQLLLDAVLSDDDSFLLPAKDFPLFAAFKVFSWTLLRTTPLAIR
jgi:Transposase IS66 family